MHTLPLHKHNKKIIALSPAKSKYTRSEQKKKSTSKFEKRRLFSPWKRPKKVIGIERTNTDRTENKRKIKPTTTTEYVISK